MNRFYSNELSKAKGKKTNNVNTDSSNKNTNGQII